MALITGTDMDIVSLFAGCGGPDLGFERAGFNVIWANEFDRSIHATYRLNHPGTILDTADVRTITGAEVPDCDGIIGGPPCQSWSEGGRQRHWRHHGATTVFPYGENIVRKSDTPEPRCIHRALRCQIHGKEQGPQVG